MATKKQRARQATARTWVWIPVPEEFTDVMGDPWITSQGDEGSGLAQILMITIRRCPVKTAGDSERAYDIIKAVLAADEADAQHITLLKEDFDWMVTHIKGNAHLLWSGPDAVHLWKWLEENVTETSPEPELEPKSVSET